MLEVDFLDQSPPPSSDWSPPRSFDEYRLLRPVGCGGMGEVFLAYDTLLDRRVAVKFIRGLQPDAECRRQFLIEARAAARVQHPNVVSIYRVGELEGRPFIISEFVRGTSLSAVDRPVPWERALEIGIGLARGLAAAHRRGVLHRDIKPGNVLLDEEGQVKLLDFGLAKLIDLGARPPPDRGSSPVAAVSVARPAARPSRIPLPREPGEQNTLTSAQSGERPAAGERAATLAASAGRSGDFVGGTPHYIAPEIWRGEAATYRADVYSLGVVLFELCAGRLPFEDVPLHELPGTTARVDAPSLVSVAPTMDTRLAAVVDRCLRRSPAERFASGEELREALERITSEGHGAPVPEGNPYRGFLPFDAEHRALFFGRSNETGTVIERLRTEPVVVIAGDSGVGKSSLCGAGVLPLVADGALGQGRRWVVRRMSPGRSPFSALATALAGVLGADEDDVSGQLRCAPGSLGRAVRRELGDARGLVLCVDQLEELVTLSDPGEAQIVSEALGQLAARLPGIRLLLTVRSDYLASVAALPGIGHEVTHALYLLRPLSPEKIREAIVGPARAKGVAFESEALIEDLVASTAQAEGLPLLQFALSELWEARAHPRSPITADALHAIGGVAGALARHADRVVLGLPEAERAAARRILMALVTLDETRAQRTSEELAAGDPTAHRALEALVRGRLLVAHEGEGGAVYAIAHDALLRGWDTLRRWIDEQQEGRAARLRLEAAAAEWARLGRAREGLWGARQLEEVARVDPSELGPGARAFLEASRRAAWRRVQRRRALVVGLPLLTLALYGGVRLNMQRDLDRRVALRVREAVELRDEAAAQSADTDRLRQEAFAAFDAQTPNEGERTWARALELGARVDATYGRASQALETALLLDASRRDVRDMLGDVLFERAVAAERERLLRHRDELVARMALHDPEGHRARRWQAPARVSLESSPPGAQVAVQPYLTDERGARHLGPMRELGQTPAADLELPAGSHLLTFTVPGRPEVRYPVLLGRGEARRVAVDVPPRSAIPRDFVYVPAGRFLFGSSFDEVKRRSFLSTVPLHEVETGPYLIARHEVTWSEWIRFLRALPAEERARRTPKIAEAGLTGGLALREQVDGSFQLTFQPAEEAYTAPEGEPFTYRARQRRATQDWLRFPVSGISRHDAEAYAAWLGATGRVAGARLCTEHEWERAARGADDREHPHGDALAADDANFDETYGKGAASMGPDEVGSHPASRSPFGLDDMAGNVFEWTTSSLEPGKSVARGGAYFYDQMTARSTNRSTLEPGFRDPRLGVRMCAAAPGALAQADAR